MSAPAVAAAPISWGVSEVAGWGYQMNRERVLTEMGRLGFTATEAGPPGYLPSDPKERAALLRRFGLRLAAGFLATVLHDAEAAGLSCVETECRALAASGANVLAIAPALADAGYESRQPLSRDDWRRLGSALRRAHSIATSFGLTLVVHPHIGTAVQSREDVETLLETTRASLCLDTGHLYLGGIDPSDLVATAGDRIKHVHLKDLDRGLASAFQAGEMTYREAVSRGVYRTLGAGDLDINGVVERLRRSGYSGWFVLEQDTALTAEPPPGRGPVESARASLAYFRRISGAPARVTPEQHR